LAHKLQCRSLCIGSRAARSTKPTPNCLCRNALASSTLASRSNLAIDLDLLIFYYTYTLLFASEAKRSQIRSSPPMVRGLTRRIENRHGHFVSTFGERQGRHFLRPFVWMGHRTTDASIRCAGPQDGWVGLGLMRVSLHAVLQNESKSLWDFDNADTSRVSTLERHATSYSVSALIGTNPFAQWNDVRGTKRNLHLVTDTFLYHFA
jgi:hypothetical protein